MSSRVAVAGLLHESNSFFSVPTRLEDFDIRLPDDPKVALGEWALNQDEVAGFVLEGLEKRLDLVPILYAVATPGGPIERDAFETLASDLCARLKKALPLDGVLLALHGAMYSEAFPHADGEILRRVREVIGAEAPLVVTHDFHANVSQEAVRYSTALIGYKTNPHVDQKERGRRAVELIVGILEDKHHPVQALVKPGMIFNIRFQNTNRTPLEPIVAQTKRLERDGVLGVSVFGGYQYADVPAVGASVVVVADGDPALAQEVAEHLAQQLRECKPQLVLDLPDPADAVRLAANLATPVVLADMGDNIGGGSPGDSTFLLDELLRQEALGWFVAIRDPEAVAQCVQAGAGQPVDVLVGGKTDNLHGKPVRVRGVVKSIHDGKFLEPAIRHGGRRHHDQGLSVVIRAEGSTPDLENLLLLTSNRQMPFTLHQLVSCGIYPERQKILVVKGTIAFRAAYEPIAGTILEVDSPGVTAVNPANFEFHRAPKDLFGLKG